MSDINFVPAEIPFKQRLAIAGKVLLVTVVLWCAVVLVLGRVHQNAIERAKAATHRWYQSERDKGKSPEGAMWSVDELDEYRDHVSKSGQVVRYEITLSIAQMSGSPAFCVVRAVRKGGVFNETLYFHGYACTSFNATPIPLFSLD